MISLHSYSKNYTKSRTTSRKNSKKATHVDTIRMNFMNLLSLSQEEANNILYIIQTQPTLSASIS